MTLPKRPVLLDFTLCCAFSFSLFGTAYAQGLKTPSGNFGSGWQVGGAGTPGSTTSSPGAATSTYGSTAYGAGSYGSNTSGAGSYAAPQGSRSEGAGSGSYSGTFSDNASAGGTSMTGSGAYPAARSAGGGLRTQ